MRELKWTWLANWAATSLSVSTVSGRGRACDITRNSPSAANRSPVQLEARSVEKQEGMRKMI